jgi:hypothetical protein
MQICPKCGYVERFDWPVMLWGISCIISYVLLGFVEDYVPRTERIWVIVIGFLCFGLFLAGIFWREYRKRMDKLQHSRSQELSKLN